MVSNVILSLLSPDIESRNVCPVRFRFRFRVQFSSVLYYSSVQFKIVQLTNYSYVTAVFEDKITLFEKLRGTAWPRPLRK